MSSDVSRSETSEKTSRSERRTAVVTGGFRGIGKAITFALIGAGYTVRPLSRADIDLSKRPRELFGQVDVLVNNAGVAYTSPALDLLPAAWDETIAVNLTAAFELSCEAVRRGATNIINISSASAVKPARNIAAYAASKAALEQMTKCLAVEWGPKVRVNCIAPGLVETDMFHPDEPEKLLERIPAGRFGTPEDIAEAVLMILNNDYITGQVIRVDGGWSLR